MTLALYDQHSLNGHASLCGVDEAGRGCLAGPVVAGAVRVEPGFYRSAWCKAHGGKVNDSKQLSAEQREELYSCIQNAATAGDLHYVAATASVAEIAAWNILGATRLAMQRCVEQLAVDTDTCLLLIDGRPLKPFPYAHTAVVKGDGASLAIALASIVAKVTRDRLMAEMHAAFPHYDFAQHKGYGTTAHRNALHKHGPCPHHRTLFLRKILGQPEGKQRTALKGK